MDSQVGISPVIAIGYRIIERVGSDRDEYCWLETDAGIITVMPGHYCDEPTLEQAQEYAARWNENHGSAARIMQVRPVKLTPDGWEPVA